MSIDCDDFDPIIESHRLPEAFDCATDIPLRLECHCLGDGPCLCFNLLEDKPRDRITIGDILEHEMEEQSNSFASKDNVSGIMGIQIEEADRTNNLHGVSAPKISADNHAMETLLTPATMDFEAETEVSSDGYRQSNETNSDEPDSCNSGETNSSTIQDDSPIRIKEIDSNTTEEIDSSTTEEVDSNATEEIDSSTTEERSSTATHRIPGVGRFQIEKTSGDGLKCGMFALQISTNKQLAGATLTPAVFNDIFRGPEMRNFNLRKGYKNRNNFEDEQLACVLRIWGREEGYGKLQLGLAVEGGSCFIVGAEDKMIFVDSEADMEKELNDGFTTIWIHNNNVMSLRGAAINHYSGVTLLDMNEEQAEAERKEAEKRKENAERQEAVLERLEATRRPREESQEREEPQKKRLKVRHRD